MSMGLATGGTFAFAQNAYDPQADYGPSSSMCGTTSAELQSTASFWSWQKVWRRLESLDDEHWGVGTFRECDIPQRFSSHDVLHRSEHWPECRGG